LLYTWEDLTEKGGDATSSTAQPHVIASQKIDVYET
jgi:hypothetical protein